jgi:hypothetical protein
MENRKSCRLVFVLYPFQGHINPMLQLATILHSRGFSITLVHPQFNSLNPSNHPEFTFIPISDDLSENKVSPVDLLGIFSALNKNSEAPFKQCIEQLLKADDPHDRISCIIYDGHMFFAQSVADHFKLPGISVRTSPAATILAFAVFPRLHDQGYISLIDLMSQDQVPDIESLRLKELTAVMRENTTDGLAELRAASTDSLKKCSAIIVNTMNFLEQEAVKRIQELFPASSIFTTA